MSQIFPTQQIMRYSMGKGIWVGNSNSDAVGRRRHRALRLTLAIVRFILEDSDAGAEEDDEP
jgi:hypothetical protein